MIEGTEQYVKPAVLRLELSMDLPVSMAQNCKTAQSPNVGASPCKGGTGNCTTVGS